MTEFRVWINKIKLDSSCNNYISSINIFPEYQHSFRTLQWQLNDVSIRESFAIPCTFTPALSPEQVDIVCLLTCRYSLQIALPLLVIRRNLWVIHRAVFFLPSPITVIRNDYCGNEHRRPVNCTLTDWLWPLAAIQDWCRYSCYSYHCLQSARAALKTHCGRWHQPTAAEPNMEPWLIDWLIVTIGSITWQVSLQLLQALRFVTPTHT